MGYKHAMLSRGDTGDRLAEGDEVLGCFVRIFIYQANVVDSNKQSKSNQTETVTPQTKNTLSSIQIKIRVWSMRHLVKRRESKALLTILYSFNNFSCEEFREEPVNNTIE